MAAYGPEATVMVRPFVQRREARETIIGDLDRRVYLAIPNEGMDILESLAAGNTVGETVRRYEEQYQEKPDIDEFLEVLSTEGFLGEQQPESHDHEHEHKHLKGLSLDWIPIPVARFLVSVPMLVLYVATVVLGFALFLSDPSAMPGHESLLFPGGSFALMLVVTFVLALAGTLVHELAHAIAARASQVPVSLGIGTLMYVLMAQTDITGIQLAPKHRRYLAFLAGTLVDLVSASILFMVIYADKHGAIAVPTQPAILLHGLLYTYLLRMLGQLFFYVRTDLYYLIAAMFNCRNLMVDTENLLLNIVNRIFRRRDRIVHQSHIPRTERSAIRVFAVFYVVGRAISLASLLLIFLPILFRIVWQFVLYASGKPATMGFLDFLVFGGLILLIYGGGIVLWLRGLEKGRRRRKAVRLATTAAR